MIIDILDDNSLSCETSSLMSPLPILLYEFTTQSWNGEILDLVSYRYDAKEVCQQKWWLNNLVTDTSHDLTDNCLCGEETVVCSSRKVDGKFPLDRINPRVKGSSIVPKEVKRIIR